MDAILSKIINNLMIENVDNTAINDIDTAFQMMSSLIEGGLPCVEVTYRTPYATKTIKNLSNHFPDALIGAGTVLTMKQARNAIDAGAKFVVSPGFDEEIVDFCIESETLVIPGCATATEIMRAMTGISSPDSPSGYPVPSNRS